MVSEFLAKFDSGELIALTAVSGGMLIAITAIVASQWRRVRVAELEIGLKQQMLDKGMSAAEIEQVVKVSPDSSCGSSVVTNESLDRAALAQRMVDNGYEGEDIERVLKAYQPNQRAVEQKSVPIS